MGSNAAGLQSPNGLSLGAWAEQPGQRSLQGRRRRNPGLQPAPDARPSWQYVNSYLGAKWGTGPTGAAAPTPANVIPDNSRVTVAAGATLSLQTSPLPGIASANETIGPLGGAGSVIIDAAATTLTVNNTPAASSGGADGTFTGAISGAGGVVKIGTGTETLSGNSSYLGQTQINEGVLVAGSDNALGDRVAGTTVADGATLAFQGNMNSPEPVTVGGAGYDPDAGGPLPPVGALENLSGNNSLSGTVTMTASTTVNVVGAGDSLNLGGVISGGATSDLIKVGPGTLGLGAINTYAGDTLIQAGTVKMINQPLPTAPVAGSLYWLDAADASKVVTSGSSVTSWLDSTANGRNFTRARPPTSRRMSPSAIDGLPVDPVRRLHADQLNYSSGSRRTLQTMFIVNRPHGAAGGLATASGACRRRQRASA